MTQIHSTAIVDPQAKIGAGVTVGAYSIVGPHVELGENCWVGPHVVLEGFTKFGSGNRIYQFASVGSDPQDLKFHGEESRLEIGNENVIREGVTLQPGTEGGGMLTKIGSSNLFMAYSHVGHDSFLGDNNILSNGVGLSGHVEIGSRVILGGMVGVHQFVRLGDFSFLAAGAMVSQDVPPYCMGHGDRCELIGINTVGLDRNGFSSEQIRTVRKMYRKLFFAEGKFEDRFEAAQEEFGSQEVAQVFLEFVRKSERGISSVRSHPSNRTERTDKSYLERHYRELRNSANHEQQANRINSG